VDWTQGCMWSCEVKDTIKTYPSWRPDSLPASTCDHGGCVIRRVWVWVAETSVGALTENAEKPWARGFGGSTACPADRGYVTGGSKYTAAS
jgi:hypothetical protein